MIKRTVASILILLVGLTTVFADESKKKEDLYFINKAQCKSKDDMRLILEREFDETPILAGSALLRSATTNQTYEGIMLFYSNISKGTYSLIVWFEQDDMSCLLVTGEELVPVTEQPKTKEKNYL